MSPPRALGRFGAVATAVATALVLASCSTGSSAAQQRARTTAVSPSTSAPAATFTTTGNEPTCTTSTLNGIVIEQVSAAGTTPAVVALHNVGYEPCSLDGFPTVTLVGANEQPIPTETNGVQPGQMDSVATRVVLEPPNTEAPDTSWVSFLVTYQTPGEAQTGANCPVSTSISVIPPGSSQAVTIPASIQASGSPCGRLAIGALYSGMGYPPSSSGSQ